MSDITDGDLRRATYKRADSYFDEQVLNSVHGCSNKKIYRERHVTDIDYDNIKYAMFPAWFVTYYHKGQHNTILVNGQSGKVVCGVPWNKVLFFTLLIAAGIALTAVSFIILKPVLTALFTDPTSGKHSSDGEGKILAVIIAGAVAMFSIGIAKIRKVIKSIDLTQANAIFNFVKKRQE